MKHLLANFDSLQNEYKCISSRNKSLKKQLPYLINELETLAHDHIMTKKELEVVTNEKELVLKEMECIKNENEELKKKVSNPNEI